jgi:hypothetical protein
MESNIINKYKLLILSIVKNLDPEIKSVGRPIIHVIIINVLKLYL